jgi:uncharacterized protein
VTAEQLAGLQRNHLGKRLFLVLWTNVSGVSREDFMDMLPIHFEFLHHLEEQGTLFGAGPLRAEGESNAAPPNGMAVLRATSFAEAASILAEEPFTKNGYRTYQLLAWTLNEGSFSVRLRFGAGTYEVG